MKNILLISIAFSFAFFSCKKKDDDANTTEKPYVVEYKNQVVQGKINGEDWELMEGGAFTYSLDDFHEVGLYSDPGDPCFGRGDVPKVLISVLQIDFIGEFDLSSVDNSELVNIYYYDGNYNNQYPKKGAFEIISADTASGEVTGRIDAYFNADNYLNGNFTVTYCDYFK